MYHDCDHVAILLRSDGQGLFMMKFHLLRCCFQSSVNGKEAKIPFPWLVFNEKVKVNSVFLRDSTAVSDSILLLFGGNIQQGGLVSSFALLICLSVWQITIEYL